MRRRRAAYGSLLVIVLLTAPSPSVASPLDIPAAVPQEFRALVRERLHKPKPKPRSEARFELETREGYRFSVVAIEDVVAIEVAKGANLAALAGKDRDGGAAGTVYVTRGSMTSQRVTASFEGLGRISVRFRPSGRVVKSPPRRRCRGPNRFTSRLGVFVGKISFEGEKRYVSVRAHRAKGRIRSPLGLRCGWLPGGFRSLGPAYGRPVDEGLKRRFSFLQAEWREGLRSAGLISALFGDSMFVLALTEESLGSMAKMRYAIATASARAFTYDDALTSARLRPPWPFSGRGSYAAAADGSKRWTGSLSAAFPDSPRFPLTGPQFKPSLSASF